MSLIPSESLNFPDSFRANVGWRLDKDDQEGTSPPPEPGAVGNPFPQPVGVPQGVAEPISTPPSTAAEPASLPTLEVDPLPPSVAPKREADDQQLELIPERATEEKPAENSSGEVEMNALLKYFQAAGSVLPPVPDQSNGKTPLPENVATVAGVVPTNVAVESPRIAVAPNEPPIIERAKVELSTPQPSEPKTESKIVGNAPASQQSIVAALESL